MEGKKKKQKNPLKTTKTNGGICTWMWLAVVYLPVCDLEQILTKYCLFTALISTSLPWRKDALTFIILSTSCETEPFSRKQPCPEGALQSRRSLKTYCALTYKQMEWAGVFDNNFYTVFCLKVWESCPAMLHNLVLFFFFNLKKSVWQN